MQRTTITLPGDLVDELTAEVDAKSKSEAVIKAVRDEIKARKKGKIICMYLISSLNLLPYGKRQGSYRIHSDVRKINRPRSLFYRFQLSILWSQPFALFDYQKEYGPDHVYSIG